MSNHLQISNVFKGICDKTTSPLMHDSQGDFMQNN